VGLYLCVFASPTDGDEVEGVEVGSYDDFHALRETIAERLEGGRWGARFPLLMSHSDSEGEWWPQEAVQLRAELEAIDVELAALAPVGFVDASWQSEVAILSNLLPGSLAECFIDVDGEPLLTRAKAPD
jgi:hypothetical protein